MSLFVGNGIQTMQGLEYHSLTNLVILELRGNCLETTDAIYLPNLRHLYLVQLLVSMFMVDKKYMMLIRTTIWHFHSTI